MDKQNAVADETDESQEDGLDPRKELWRERPQSGKGFPQNCNDNKRKDRLSNWNQRASHAQQRAILEPGLGFPKQLFVEGFGNIRDGVETPFSCPLQKVLRLIGEIFLNLLRDVSVPTHPAQRLIEHRHGHAAACRLLLLPVDFGRFRWLFLEKLHGSQPAA